MREMARAMREQANATTQILRHMQEETDHRPPARPNEADACRGWAEFQNARPPTFRGEFNQILAEGCEGVEKYKQKVSFNNKRPMNFSKGGNNKGKKPMLGATHSIINSKCVKELKLLVTTLPSDLAISTPTGECVVTSLICLNCPIIMEHRSFDVDLICMNLTGINVILGMN
ncbi:Transposon Tf2-9 polyprotein [Senna tora]|uniref:Transposon Tf2-9 polyprotein n=1 Tax=Senna tora TaxID=362788 RepID=A0A834SN25_9FABA|nr:Transposon Tf2-9 polyprotein [Senna tora]